jgi:hypothetical protein
MWGTTLMGVVSISGLFIGFEIALNSDVGFPRAIAQISRALCF